MYIYKCTSYIAFPSSPKVLLVSTRLELLSYIYLSQIKRCLRCLEVICEQDFKQMLSLLKKILTAWRILLFTWYKGKIQPVSTWVITKLVGSGSWSWLALSPRTSLWQLIILAFLMQSCSASCNGLWGSWESECTVWMKRWAYRNPGAVWPWGFFPCAYWGNRSQFFECHRTGYCQKIVRGYFV